MELDSTSNRIITAAYNEAKFQKHEFLTPEHLLYSALFFDEGCEVIENCGGDIDILKSHLAKHLKEHVPVVEDLEPEQSVGFNKVIQTAAMHCFSSGKDKIRFSDILVALYSEKESFAVYYLKQQGITRLEVLKYISHGRSKTSLPEESDKREAGKKEGKQEQGKPGDFLPHFTVELVEKARAGEVDPLIGREEILRRTIHVLSRRMKNNPIHVGDPGVGKTAITEGLAKLIADGKVPDKLRGSRIYSLDMGSLLAGTKYRGDFEERIKKVLNELQKQEKAIVYIDEIHTVVGAGAVSGGTMDASNIIKPYLTSGKLRFIGSTTFDEYKKVFEKDRALSRRFQKVDVSEPTIEETVKILEGLRGKYEEYHQVTYTEKALRFAAELSSKYINDRQLPDKAIDVLDEAGACVRMEAGESEERPQVDETVIEKTISAMTKIPEQTVSGSEIDKLRELDTRLKQEIYGQNPAVDTVAKAIRRSRAGFKEGEKPVASLLFVGPTGVGKTELTKQVAAILGIPLTRFDMSEYQEKHAVARLIGAPPGYVGYEEGGLLTDAIRRTPHCVLLLDEIEKAHQDIYNVLLQVMDYATLTDNTGKKADFQNVILIMTSNAGAREVGRTLIGFEKRYIDQGAMAKEVEKVFLPEFRNRLDEIVVFNAIDEAMALQIAKKAVGKFESKLAAKNVELKVTDACYQWLAQKGLSSLYGAREIYRVVQEKITSRFVDEVLFGKLSQGGRAVVDVEEDTITVVIEP